MQITIKNRFVQNFLKNKMLGWENLPKLKKRRNTTCKVLHNFWNRIGQRTYPEHLVLCWFLDKAQWFLEFFWKHPRVGGYNKIKRTTFRTLVLYNNRWMSRVVESPNSNSYWKFVLNSNVGHCLHNSKAHMKLMKNTYLQCCNEAIVSEDSLRQRRSPKEPTRAPKRLTKP